MGKLYRKTPCPFCRTPISSAGFAWGPHRKACLRKLRKAAPIPHAKIESIKQSPLSGNRWCLQLDCGHDEWVTAKRRPTRQTIRCSKCVMNATSNPTDRNVTP